MMGNKGIDDSTGQPGGNLGNAMPAVPQFSGEPKRQPFGNRFLTNPENVFQHNAWDNVSWDEDKLAEAQKKVEGNSGEMVEQHMQEKYEADADQFWNDFYSQHQNRFFKDRHWLFTEFPELAASVNTKSSDVTAKDDSTLLVSSADVKNVQSSRTKDLQETESCPQNVPKQDGKTGLTKPNKIVESEQGGASCLNVIASSGRCVVDVDSDDMSKMTISGTMVTRDEAMDSEINDGKFPGHWARTRILEVGCGVGNTVFPILQTNNDPDLFVYCCDFSDVAIKLVKSHADYHPRRCHAFVFDITDEGAHLPFPENSLDVVILIFVLSAVHPDKMQSSMNRLSKCLKPGGLLLLRDYGRYDMAQLRFKKGRCLSEHFYVRGDGTRVYFFTQDELRDLFTNAGLLEEQNLVDRRLQVNRGRQLTMYRVWIQCKYRKPVSVS